MDKNENKEHKELYDLIRNLGKGIRKHGLKKVVRALKEINIVSESEKKIAIIDFIEKIVCDRLGVPSVELFNFNSRGEITIARKLCILLIRKYISISDDELANHYNRTRQIVHNAEKEFRLLKQGKINQFHIDFKAIYDELNNKTKEFVEKAKVI